MRWPFEPSQANIYNFTPTDVSGCYAWYHADAIGQSDNSTLLNFADFSGSGNHMTGSGIFHTNIINGYPAILLQGLPGQGFAASGTDSCNNNTFNISAFYVFSTVDPTGIQGLMSYQKPPAGNSTTYYGSFIGQTTPAPSSWSYIYQSAGDQLISSNNVNYSAGDWIVRSDRSKTGYIQFFKNSIIQSSGTGSLISNATGSGNQLKFGYTGYSVNSVFNGYIAEMALFSPALSDTDALGVETYLKQKYFINLFSNNLSNAPTLYIGSTTISSSSTTLFMSGIPPVARSPMTMFLDCATPISSSFPLLIGGNSTPPTASSTTLFMHGLTTENGGLFPLYTKSVNPPFMSGHFTMYMCNGPVNFSSISQNNDTFNSALFNNVDVASGNSVHASGIGNNLWMYIQTDDRGATSANMPLSISGPLPSSVSNSFSLYVQNSVVLQQSGIKLYIGSPGSLDGGSIFNNNMNLFMNTTPGQYQQTSLFINNQMGLSSAPLYILCGLSGVYNNTNMFIRGNEPVASSIISLFCLPTLSISNNFTIMISGYQTPTKNLTIYTNGF